MALKDPPNANFFSPFFHFILSCFFFSFALLFVAAAASFHAFFFIHLSEFFLTPLWRLHKLKRVKSWLPTKSKCLFHFLFISHYEMLFPSSTPLLYQVQKRSHSNHICYFFFFFLKKKNSERGFPAKWNQGSSLTSNTQWTKSI